MGYSLSVVVQQGRGINFVVLFSKAVNTTQFGGGERDLGAIVVSFSFQKHKDRNLRVARVYDGLARYPPVTV